jgi:hypothetical protein
MIHRDCGGTVTESSDGAGYRFTGEDAETFGAFVPKYVCRKCGVEIVGDSQIILSAYHERFTQRGFENFAKIIDTHHNLIVVRESSQVGGSLCLGI